VTELTEKDWNRMEKTGIDGKSLTLIFLAGYGKPEPNQRLIKNGYIGLITRRSQVQFHSLWLTFLMSDLFVLPMDGNMICGWLIQDPL